MATKDTNPSHAERPDFPPPPPTQPAAVDATEATYGLYLLEEIRTLLMSITQLNARMYDRMTREEHEDDEQTWKAAMKTCEESTERMRVIKEQLDGDS